MTIEIVDFPINNGDFPVRYVNLPEGNMFHISPFHFESPSIHQNRVAIGRGAGHRASWVSANRQPIAWPVRLGAQSHGWWLPLIWTTWRIFVGYFFLGMELDMFDNNIWYIYICMFFDMFDINISFFLGDFLWQISVLSGPSGRSGRYAFFPESGAQRPKRRGVLGCFSHGIFWKTIGKP